MQTHEGLPGWAVGPTSVKTKKGRKSLDGTLLRAGLGLRAEPYLLDGTDDEGLQRVIAEFEWVVTHLATGLVVARFNGQVGDAIVIVERIVRVADWAEEKPQRAGLKEAVQAAVSGDPVGRAMASLSDEQRDRLLA